MKIKNKKTKTFLIGLGSLILLSGFYVASAAVLQIFSGSSQDLQIPDIEKGLIAHYPLAQEDLKSASVIADTTPYGRDGTITAGAGGSTADQRGVANRAYDFDGSATFISAGSNPIVGNASFTLSAWMKLEAHTTYGLGVFIGNGAGGQSAWIGNYSAGPNLGGGFYGTNYDSGVIGTDGWHHVVFNFSGGVNGTASLYVDGVYKNGGVISPNLSSASIILGKANTGTPYWYNGQISDVRIYNRALPVGEIRQLYQSYRPSIVIPDIEKGLIARFPLDAETKQSVTTFIDTTPNARIGTITVGSSTGLSTDQRGVANRAYDFSSSTIVTVGDWIGTQAITVSAWIYLDVFSVSGYPVLLSNGKTYFFLDGPGQRLAFRSNGDGGGANDVRSTAGSIAAGRWYFITATRSSANPAIVNFYINGSLNNGNLSNGTTVAGTGNTGIGGIAALDGRISDLRVYNRVLSAPEIQQLYQAYQ